VFIVFMGLRQRSQQLEMRHRERMAMIERGQIPLDQPASGVVARHVATAPAASSRSLSVGILIIGLGLALMTIISIAGDSPEVGVGIGGAIAIIGAAFVVRSLIVKPALVPSPKSPEEPPI
jgi:hypothetical protein